MKAIQILLAILLALLFLFYFARSSRDKIMNRVLLALMFAAGFALVVFPDITQLLANLAGVGRGVDLLFYLGFVFMFSLWLKLYITQRQQDRQMTLLIRRYALEHARTPEQSTSQNSAAQAE